MELLCSANPCASVHHQLKAAMFGRFSPSFYSTPTRSTSSNSNFLNQPDRLRCHPPSPRRDISPPPGIVALTISAGAIPSVPSSSAEQLRPPPTIFPFTISVYAIPSVPTSSAEQVLPPPTKPSRCPLRQASSPFGPSHHAEQLRPPR